MNRKIIDGNTYTLYENNEEFEKDLPNIAKTSVANMTKIFEKPLTETLKELEAKRDRFKFRVWNIKNKNFIYDAIYAYDGNNYDSQDNDGWIYCFGEYINRNDEYDVEQCIGKKDMNGVLIYENDIVKDINGHYGYIKWDSEELKYFVYKRLGVVPYWTPCSMVHSYEYEIVGNIHQNKDLLEEEK